MRRILFWIHCQFVRLTGSVFIVLPHSLRWVRPGYLRSCCLFVFGTLLIARGQDLTVAVSYDFEQPQIDIVDNTSTRLSIRKCQSFHQIGQPDVPFRTGRILLPPNATVKRVDVELPEAVQTISVTKPLLFGRTPVPIGVMDHPSVARAARDAPDQNTYAVDTPYPATRVQLMSVQKMKGYSVAVVRVFPVQYQPASGKLLFCPQVRVSVTVPDAPVQTRAVSMLRANESQVAHILSFVDNPEAATDYANRRYQSYQPLSIYDYLLVTPAALTNSFQPLVEQKIADGLSVKVATVEKIIAEYPGVDDAAKLRAFITYAYTNWNTTYVLLGGDISSVPYRKAFASCDGVDNTMPCDLYFACLDGSWNADGDSLWGEPTDGEGGGDVDLLAEVYVGRAPVDTATEVTNFISKTIFYEQNRHVNVESVRLLGEYLGNYSGTYAQGGDCLDILLPSFSSYAVAWLDDRPNHEETWAAAECVDALNHSPHIVAHDGHANETYALRMNESHISGLTNAAPFLLNSLGCYCGAFDYSDAFAEELVKRNATGAFSVVMNSRYGWFDSENEGLFSGEFMACFFDELLVQGKRNIGVANQWAKQDLLGSVEISGTDMVYRWCYFEITLFGDPHTLLQPGDDLKVSPLSDVEAEGIIGGPFLPSEGVYALTNAGAADVTWTVTYGQNWLTVAPSEGVLPSGGVVDVVASINDDAMALSPGVYHDTLVFSNAVSGFVRSRGVSLRVLAMPGEIMVTDSITPTDDLNMPFGPVIVGVSQTANVTVHNTDLDHELVLSAIDGGGYQEDFEDGLAQDWTPSVLSYWGVTNGEYVAQGAVSDWMMSTYTGGVWQDAAVQMAVWMTEEALSPAGLFFRASEDFVIDVSGSAYGVVIVAGYFCVGKWVDGEFLLVSEDWTSSPFLNVGDAPNLVTVSFQTNAITVYFNGEKAWEGTDDSLAGPGRIALAGYSENGAVHRFDRVAVGEKAEFETGVLARAVPEWHVLPSFLLSDLPSFPCTLAPGCDLTFSVSFAPRSVGTHQTAVIITSNDSDEPTAAVAVSGDGLPDYLSVLPETGLGGSGHPGGPFTPVCQVYGVSNNSAVEISWAAVGYPAWVTVTPASGTLVPGSSEPVMVAFNDGASSLPEGDYNGGLVFSNVTTTVVQTRLLTLEVFTTPVVRVAPAILTITNVLGQVRQTQLQVGNAAWADGLLDFSLWSSSEANLPLVQESINPSAVRDFTVLPKEATYQADELLVRFKETVPGLVRSAALAKAGGGTVTREFKLVPGLTVVRLPAGIALEDALVQFNRTADILYAQPNYRHHVNRVPNDPLFKDLWGLHNTGQSGVADTDIDAPEAWESSVGGPYTMTVAVIDTGIDYTHEDLVSNMWVNPGEIPGNGIDDDGNGYVDDIHGYDFCNGDADPMDDHDHGTHCAGTIGAAGDNGLGVAGVCWNVKIMALKFISAADEGYTDDAISCIEYAVQMGARVLSNSWGGSGYEQALKDAIDAAGAANALFIAAAGNDYGNDNDVNPVYPASYESDHVISVMSVTSSGTMSSFSNYGLESVDLAAPGTAILSCKRGGGYQLMNGTSMAVPHVSGACALLLARNNGLSCSQVKNALLAATDASLPGLCVSGGLMNLAEALADTPAWLRVQPEAGGRVAPGAWSNVTVTADAGVLAAGTYEGVIRVRSNDRDTPVTNVPVALVVLHDDLAVQPAGGLAARGYSGGPFLPDSLSYTVTNAGMTSLSWSAGGTEPWVSVSPGNGTLAAGQSAQVLVAFTMQAGQLSHGEYPADVVFSNQTTTAAQYRPVRLTVLERALTRFEWEPFAPTQYVGQPFGVTVKALDGAGSVWPAFTGPVALYATTGGGGQQSVLTGTNAWNYPMSTYYHDARTQVIYQTGELGPSGLLTGLSLYVSTLPGLTMNAWTIRLRHTDLAGYNAATQRWETNDWTVALQTNVTITATGWVRFAFTTPFFYNGTNNVMVDFSYNNGAYATDGTCWATVVSTNRSLYFRTDSGYGDPLTWSGIVPAGKLSATVPVMIIDTVEGVPITPSVSGDFTEGIWNGTVTVLDYSTNVTLFAQEADGSRGGSALFDTVFQTVGLSEALDNETREWTTGGTADWIGQKMTAHDGVDAAQSGIIGNRQESWMETIVTGPGTASFWWRVSCETDWDWLEFYVDDVLADRISGDTGWLWKEVSLTTGEHTLQWRYVKDSADIDPVGYDRGWIDQFVGPTQSVLPPEWLSLYGLPLDGSADYVDSDGDSMSNWAEWVAGTVPTNMLSFLQMEAITPQAGANEIHIRWQSVPGKLYWVESCDTLTYPIFFTPFVSNVLGQAGSTEIWDSRPAANGSRFYRVGVQQE